MIELASPAEVTGSSISNGPRQYFKVVTVPRKGKSKVVAMLLIFSAVSAVQVF